MSREKLFSLGPKDFRVEFFTAGVKAGGSGKDTSNTACRIVHIESGAEGMSKDERSQKQNKKLAFERMFNSKKFQNWYKLKTAAAMAGYMEIEKMINIKVDQAMQSKNLKIETKYEDGKWEALC